MNTYEVTVNGNLVYSGVSYFKAIEIHRIYSRCIPENCENCNLKLIFIPKMASVQEMNEYLQEISKSMKETCPVFSGEIADKDKLPNVIKSGQHPFIGDECSEWVSAKCKNYNAERVELDVKFTVLR